MWSFDNSKRCVKRRLRTTSQKEFSSFASFCAYIPLSQQFPARNRNVGGRGKWNMGTSRMGGGVLRAVQRTTTNPFSRQTRPGRGPSTERLTVKGLTRQDRPRTAIGQSAFPEGSAISLVELAHITKRNTIAASLAQAKICCPLGAIVTGPFQAKRWVTKGEGDSRRRDYSVLRVVACWLGGDRNGETGR